MLEKILLLIVFWKYHLEVLGYGFDHGRVPIMKNQKSFSCTTTREFLLFEKRKKDGYQFGDISKSVFKSFRENVNKLTGKDSYEFGDLSKWLDAKAKAKVQDYTKKDGDYEFGDISKEIIQRVRSGEYAIDDILFLCKVLIAVGIEFQPVASVLPVKLLVEILDLSIAQDVNSRIVDIVSKELDKRLKQAWTSNETNQIGDLTKRAIGTFTGKDEYSVGDIFGRILELQAGMGLENVSKIALGTKSSDENIMESNLSKELDALDQITAASRQRKIEELLK